MFHIARLNTAISVAFQTRTFTSAPVLALEVASTVTKKADSLQGQALAMELAKEKGVLLELEEKFKMVRAEEKAMKAQALEKKREERALRPYRRLSALNVFIKENCKAFGGFVEIGKIWGTLSESEKAEYAAKAQKLNEQNLKVCRPKPTRPMPAYAKFVKSVWTPSEPFSVACKSISSKWRQLSQKEKDSYGPEPAEWDAYRKALASWRDERIKRFESNSL